MAFRANSRELLGLPGDAAMQRHAVVQLDFAHFSTDRARL
jgi:hypothetical protein